MKLAIYNGSPRGSASNSNKFAEFLQDGFGDNVAVSNHCINKPDKHADAINDKADAYFIVFPLYADAMPYAVKLFFETMDENKEIYKDKNIYYFIHSGFPEAIQSRILERYSKYFTQLIGAQYMGTAIMGNSEGLRHMKEKSKRRTKILENMKMLANDIEMSKPFNAKSIDYFKGMETMPKFVLFLLEKFPNVFKKGFDVMFKKNDVFEKRYDKPYA